MPAQINMSNQEDVGDISLKKRGRKQNDLDQYVEKTQKTIDDLAKRIEASKDKKEIKRLRNMISAYESRLNKRETVEQLRSQIELRNQQVAVMLKVMKQELTPEMLNTCLRRIRLETPKMVTDGLRTKIRGGVSKRNNNLEKQHAAADQIEK